MSAPAPLPPPDAFPDIPPLLRVPDLARLLGIGANGVRAMIARGELPASKLGRQFIVRRDALLARLKAMERATSRPVDIHATLRALTGPSGRRRTRSRGEMKHLLRAARPPST